MHYPRRVLPALVAVLAVLLTSCGSSGSGESPVESSGVLRVGTEGVYAPFSYHDPATGQLTGSIDRITAQVADAADAARLMAELAAKEVTHVCLEASSHGIDQRRLDGVALKAAAETLDHGMLNEHPGLELPSLENLCLWFARTLRPDWPGLCRIQVARPTINERCVLTL